MPIQVTCPGCFSKFAVSDKYAGKKGPCPKCKKEINIPELKDEVVIHAPDNLGPKDTAGRPVLKPIRRREVKFGMPRLIGTVIGGIVVLACAIVIRQTVAQPPTALFAVGAFLIAPPLIYAGYQFLRDDELGSFSDKELWLRTAICSLIFAATWGLYVFLAFYFGHKALKEIAIGHMAIYFVLMAVAGTLASIAIFEFEVLHAVLHYFLYLVITLILCVISGLELGEPFARPTTKTSNVPASHTDPPLVVPDKAAPSAGNLGG